MIKIRTKDDPVIERVRAVRKRIVRRCGGDQHRLLQWAKHVESSGRYKVAGFEKPTRTGKAESIGRADRVIS